MRRILTAFALAGALVLSGCGYNDFQTKDEQVKAAWSEVINQYKRRADLIPNLVNVVQGFAQQEKDVLLSFGGAYSNHLFALAAAGLHFGFKTIGVIRGEAYLPLNPVLAFAREAGMELHYMDRETYRRKTAHRWNW